MSEFDYPPHVQDALDFIERESAAYGQRKQREADNQRKTEEYRAWGRSEAQSRSLERARIAESDAKFWETRRRQQAAQHAKRRFQPAQPDGWVRP